MIASQSPGSGDPGSVSAWLLGWDAGKHQVAVESKGSWDGVATLPPWATFPGT